MIECSLQDMKAKCNFECDEEGFVCEHCERLVRPACAGLVPGLEVLADTGSEEEDHLPEPKMSRNDQTSHRPCPGRQEEVQEPHRKVDSDRRTARCDVVHPKCERWHPRNPGTLCLRLEGSVHSFRTSHSGPPWRVHRHGDMADMDFCVAWPQLRRLPLTSAILTLPWPGLQMRKGKPLVLQPPIKAGHTWRRPSIPLGCITERRMMQPLRFSRVASNLALATVGNSTPTLQRPHWPNWKIRREAEQTSRVRSSFLQMRPSNMRICLRRLRKESSHAM